MSSYVEQAVDALVAAYEANLPAELALVESESVIDAGSLPQPKEYLSHMAEDDNRSPLIQIYDDPGLEVENQRNKLWTVPVTVVLAWSSDADIAAAAVFVRRYVTALMRSVLRDETLGGAATSTSFVGGESAKLEGDRSSTRHLYGLGWAVSVHSVLPDLP